MACGQVIGSLNAFQRVTVVSTSDEQFFPTTEWMPLCGLDVRAWLNFLSESIGGTGVAARAAWQAATVVTDQPAANGGRGDWNGFGTAITTEDIHPVGTITGLPNGAQFIRFGFGATKDGAGDFGQADVSAMFEVKPCGKVVEDINVAGIEVEATRDIPVSDWFPTVDTTDVRIGYLLDADSTVRLDWRLQVALDTNRPSSSTPISGAVQVAGAGSGTYVSGNTTDLDISSELTPGTVTDTPAWARIMARVSVSAGGAAAIDQLVANVQVR